jgi:hypothetical protein
MGLFNNPEKEQRKQFAASLNAQRESTDTGVVQQMNEQGSVAFDPQVSGLILESERRYLPWRVDFEKNVLVLPEKYRGLKEPYSRDDVKSFLSPEEKKIVWEGYELLDQYFTVGEKYGWDDKTKRAFNKVVLSLEHPAHISRMDGKSVKASKSQYVESTADINRFNSVQRKEKFLGLF